MGLHVAVVLRHDGDVSEPASRQIDSWRAAEENAASWMRYWGYVDAVTTGPGSDAGIDVRAAKAIAQVKWEASQAGRPTLQRLVGARGADHDVELLFFSGAGFARPAVAYGDTMNIALFKYELNGKVSPVNQAARDVVSRGSSYELRQAIARGRAEHDAVPGHVDLPGKTWFGRNWTAVFGSLCLLCAVVGLPGRGSDHGDWRATYFWGIAALILMTAWLATARLRRRWKHEREAAIQAWVDEHP